jgi:hypothetical protein
VGLTIETMISMDADAASARGALYAPPQVRIPALMWALDGCLAQGKFGPRFDAPVRDFSRRYDTELESQDSFGWRNWGDDQIGTSMS